MMNLNNVLFANGASTTLAGVILLIIPNRLSTLFGLSVNGYLIAVGIFFSIFGAFVLYQAFQWNVSKATLRFITTIDWLWVLISAALIGILLGTVSPIGLLIMVIIALWVALMAFLEGKYL
jgi:hypothetical protein